MANEPSYVKNKLQFDECFLSLVNSNDPIGKNRYYVLYARTQPDEPGRHAVPACPLMRWRNSTT